MTRVILCVLGEKPCVISIATDLGSEAALKSVLGAPFARIPLLDDGIALYCDHQSLLFGLALVRRALAMARAEPWRPDVTLHLDRSALNQDEWPDDPNAWRIGGDFLLARIATDGELVDLTDADIRRWMFWLGLDDIMNPWWT